MFLVTLKGSHKGPFGRADGLPIGQAVRPPVRQEVGPSVGWAGPSGSPTGAKCKRLETYLKFSTFVSTEGNLDMAQRMGIWAVRPLSVAIGVAVFQIPFLKTKSHSIWLKINEETICGKLPTSGAPSVALWAA